ncbi:uncharacterized protein LOC135071402 [Ostrinia nubilalis]|uniref:uncharacterized protein LOC135071402 n=1 Tax=Ostrinia nubilalis TaxID=29057 RepID=UPI0030824C2E
MISLQTTREQLAVESTRYSVSDVPFPAVAVCDSTAVYGPNTVNITNIFKRRGFSNDEIKAFYESIDGVKLASYVPEDQIIKMHGLLESMGYAYSRLLETLRKPCDVLLMECIWRSRSYNCSHMFREVQTYHGFCCQFDIPYFRSNVKDVAYASGIETTEGLMVKINTDYICPTGAVSSGSALLYLFDHKDSITILDSSITLSASTFYDVNVEVWAIDSSDNVKDLPIGSRKCLLNNVS